MRPDEEINDIYIQMNKYECYCVCFASGERVTLSLSPFDERNKSVPTNAHWGQFPHRIAYTDIAPIKHIIYNYTARLSTRC